MSDDFWGQLLIALISVGSGYLGLRFAALAALKQSRADKLLDRSVEWVVSHYGSLTEIRRRTADARAALETPAGGDAECANATKAVREAYNLVDGAGLWACEQTIRELVTISARMRAEVLEIDCTDPAEAIRRLNSIDDLSRQMGAVLIRFVRDRTEQAQLPADLLPAAAVTLPTRGLADSSPSSTTKAQ